MGRYFLYRIHPITLGELARPIVSTSPVHEPTRIDEGSVADLLRLGGYPEPFLKSDTRFHTRRRRLRSEFLFREDLRNLTLIQDAGQVEVLGSLLAGRKSGSGPSACSTCATRRSGRSTSWSLATDRRGSSWR